MGDWDQLLKHGVAVTTSYTQLLEDNVASHFICVENVNCYEKIPQTSDWWSLVAHLTYEFYRDLQVVHTIPCGLLVVLSCLLGRWCLDHSSQVCFCCCSVLFGWNQYLPSSSFIVCSHGPHGKLKAKVGFRTSHYGRKLLSLKKFLPWKVCVPVTTNISLDFYIEKPVLTLKKKLLPLLKCLVSPLWLTYFLFEIIKRPFGRTGLLS